MPGALDTLFKNVAKTLVADFGKSLDTTIVYTRKGSANYNVATGAVTTTDVSYSFDAPVEFVFSDEEGGYQENTARVYITPDLIGDNQANLQDEITLTFDGSTRVSKIQDIRTFRGGQEYLYIIRVVF